MSDVRNMENYSISIGSRIRDARKAAKLTQSDLGNKLGKNLRTVQKYESGEIEPAFSTIMQISSILDVSPAFLLGLREKFSTANELEQRAYSVLNTSLAYLNYYRDLWLQGGKDADKYEQKHWETLKELNLKAKMYDEIFLRDTTIHLKAKETGGNEYVLVME